MSSNAGVNARLYSVLLSYSVRPPVQIWSNSNRECQYSHFAGAKVIRSRQMRLPLLEPFPLLYDLLSSDRRPGGPLGLLEPAFVLVML